LQQKRCNYSKRNPERYSCAPAKKDGKPPLARRKPVRGHANDYGVVATQDEIDEDNFKNGR
jgi:hypothetical protein